MKERYCIFILLFFFGIIFISCKEKYTCSKKSSIFIDNCNGTMTDKRTGLTWLKKPLNKKLYWLDAVKYVKDFSFAGKDDWRLPTEKELEFFSKATGKTPKEWYQNYKTYGLIADWFMKQGFQNINTDQGYWSSSIYSSRNEKQGYESDSAYYIHFEYGQVSFAHKTCCKNYLWPIRGGKDLTRRKNIDSIEYNSQKIDIVRDEFRGYISGDCVRLREYPSSKSNIIGYFKQGTPVVIQKRTKKKYKIGNYNDYWYLYTSYIGWVYGAFIKKGNFDKEKYINDLPALAKIPELYKKVQKHHYLYCPKESLVGENISCGSYPVIFHDKVISDGHFNLEGKYGNRTLYKILSFSVDDNNLLIKAGLLFSYHPVKKAESCDNIIKIKIYNDIDVIHFEDRKIYKYK